MTITKGFKFETIEGEGIVTGFNGSIAYVDHYVIDENDDLQFECERMLTLHEIEHLMKEVDGKNHKITWAEEVDE